jgi:hypothetical protein
MTTLAQNQTFEQTALITVPFHGNNLFIVNHNNEPYTPMKPIVEGMGLDWAAQFTKLKQRFASCIAEITIQLPSDTQQRAMTCLPIRKLFGWLNSISPNKVNPEIRDTVIMYQNECDDALYAYWTKGVAINPRTTITPEQQATLHAIVDRRVNGFDSLRGGLWKRHNRHFGIAKYNQLLASRFDDAVVYLEAVELRYPTPKNKLNDGYHFFVVKDGQSVYEKVIKADASGLTSDVLGSQPILLEHIRQVVGEFVGKGALPAPKPTLDINYPVSWIVENNKPMLKAANTLFNKVSFSLYDLTHPDVRLPTKAILNTLKIAGYCVEAAEAEMFALYNQLSKCRDAIVSIEALTNTGMRQYSSTWPVIPA